MLFEEYKSNQLISIFESLLNQKTSGILVLRTKVESWQSQRECSFIFRNGKLIFSDNSISNPEQLGETIGKKINPDSINAALIVIKQRINNSQSYQEFIDLLVKMNVITWDDVTRFVLKKVILNLELFLSYPGESHWQTNYDFDLFTGENQAGSNWSYIKAKLDLRKRKWDALMPAISNIDQIPLIVTEKLSQIDKAQIRSHLEQWIDGKRSLLDIAEQLGEDPYKVAQTYHTWLKKGWLEFQYPVNQNQKLPIVLSLDDSPIVQKMIQRSLSQTCDVILADQTTEAMEIMNRLPVKMLLLDLTLPDVDGLEFCQTIRKIPKFKDLPIVMITGREGLVNRAKGHLAGTTKYITKPFKPQELREIANQYIS